MSKIELSVLGINLFLTEVPRLFQKYYCQEIFLALTINFDIPEMKVVLTNRNAYYETKIEHFFDITRI